MATSASRSRLFPARARKSYRLEMEGRTLYLLLSLMALTGVVIFYLGLVTGKALRDPNAPVALSAQLGAPAPDADASPAAEKLAFGNALKGDGKVEGLRLENQQASQVTEALVSEAQRQLKLEETTPEAPKVTEAPVAAQPPARSQLPAPSAPTPPRVAQPVAPPADDGSLYTVQVFSSQREENARQLMNRLRGQGFAAYMNRFEAADRQVWYRVRVGKTNRTDAETLQSRLKSEAKLKNPQVQKL